MKNSDSVASCPAGSDCHWSIYMVFVGDIEACDVLCAGRSVQMWRDAGECVSSTKGYMVGDIIPFGSFASDNIDSWTLFFEEGGGRRDVANGDNMYCRCMRTGAWYEMPRSTPFGAPSICPIFHHPQPRMYFLRQHGAWGVTGTGDRWGRMCGFVV